MNCPYCPASLSVREYAWTHTHPTVWGRPIGGALMLVGFFHIAIAVLMFSGR